VACKKYSGIYKKDYEPYQALGPQIGVFDQRAAEEITHFVDGMGIDAIQMGGMVAWIMELISRDRINPGDFGLPSREEMNFTFTPGESNDNPDLNNPEKGFDIVSDSYRNAAYAQKIVEMILFTEAGAIFRQGIRTAAHILNQQEAGIEGRQKPSITDLPCSQPMVTPAV